MNLVNAAENWHWVNYQEFISPVHRGLRWPQLPSLLSLRGSGEQALKGQDSWSPTSGGRGQYPLPASLCHFTWGHWPSPANDSPRQAGIFWGNMKKQTVWTNHCSALRNADRTSPGRSFPFIFIFSARPCICTQTPWVSDITDIPVLLGYVTCPTGVFVNLSYIIADDVGNSSKIPKATSLGAPATWGPAQPAPESWEE